MSDEPQGGLRLDGSIVPRRYALDFVPNAKEKTLKGTATITCVAERPDVRRITLHALQINIETATVTVGSQTWPTDPAATPTLPVVYTPDTQQAHIDLPEPLGDAGTEFTITLEYTAKIGSGTTLEGKRGMYQCDGSDEETVATHLEPTHARRLYPCFDEPALKAVFVVSVTARTDYTVISNTEVDSETVVTPPHRVEGHAPDAPPSGDATGYLSGSDAPSEPETHIAPGTRRVTFKETPMMCTYLVSVLIGQFHCLETDTKRHIIVRVLFPKEYTSNSGYYALDLLKKAVEFYEEYFGANLPLRKIDLAGLKRFPALAMENWGLLFFDVDYLLVHTHTSLERRQRIARLVGHEVGHQWFGNLVSVKWWSCLWLKEGFCRYLEYVFVNSCYPRWQLWTQFMIQIHGEVLLRDCNEGNKTHPIEMPELLGPDEIYRHFDQISYGKGAAVLRMIASIMGEDAFSTSLKHLVATHSLHSISREDFCASIQTAMPSSLQSLDIDSYVSQWVSKSGHPYLYVREVDATAIEVVQYTQSHGYRTGFMAEVARQSGMSPRLGNSLDVDSSDVLRKSRQRYVNAPRSAAITPGELLQESNYPIVLRTFEVCAGKSTAAHNKRFTGSKLVVSRNPDDASGTMYFNSGGYGVFRVDYATPLWLSLFAALPFFGVMDRLSVCLSVCHLRAYHVGSPTPGEEMDRCLLLLKYLCDLSEIGEMHAAIWTVVIDTVQQLMNLFGDHPLRVPFSRLVLHILRPVMDQLTLPYVHDTEGSSTQRLGAAPMARALTCVVTAEHHAVQRSTVRYYYGVMSGLTGDTSLHLNASVPLFVEESDAEAEEGSNSGRPEHEAVEPVDAASVDEDVLTAVLTAAIELQSPTEFWQVYCLLCHLIDVPAESPASMDLLAHPSLSMPVVFTEDGLSGIQSKNAWCYACLTALLHTKVDPLMRFFAQFLTTIGSKGTVSFVGRVLVTNTKLLAVVAEVFRPNPAVFRVLQSAVLDAAVANSGSDDVIEFIKEGSWLAEDAASAEKFRVVELNKVWVQYVSDHYMSFIRSTVPSSSADMGTGSIGLSDPPTPNSAGAMF